MNKQEFERYTYLNRKIDDYRHKLKHEEVNRLDQYLKERDELIKRRFEKWG